LLELYSKRINDECLKNMNNQSVPDGVRVGEWLSEAGLSPDKIALWPHSTEVAHSLVEDAKTEKVVGMSPRGIPYLGPHQDAVSVAWTTSHGYTGGVFDFEYGWAIADDTTTALDPQIDPETNLHKYDYPDEDERDLALERAFSRITDTTDRLLKDEDATTLYSMAGTNRYQMPALENDLLENQFRYAERISDHLEQKGFKTEVMHNPCDSKHVYLSGKR
jgi:hypothetical protein